GAQGQAMTWPYLAAFAVVCLMTYAAGLWWVAQGSATQQRDQAIVRMEMLADNLSSSVEPLLASGELSAVRRLISEAGYQQQLDTCRVLLADGETLVDANLDKPQLMVMPANWSSKQSDASDTLVLQDTVQVDRVVPIPGKGDVLLTLSSTLQPSTMLIKPMLPGAVLIGILGLACGALVLRKLQGRLAVLTLIRGALRDAGQGMPDLSALTVNPAWGSEAEGWNRLITLTQTREQEAIEQTLETLNARSGGGKLEEACEGIGQGLLLTDSNGKVIYHNGNAAASLGLERDDTLGKHLSPLLPNEDQAMLFEQMLSGNGPGRARVEIEVGDENEMSTLRITMRRMMDSGGVMVTIEDVTQQRTAEASRHDFVSQATHELRTPLTNIRMYVETAQTDGEEDQELRGECLNVISRESQRLERLVTEMLSVSEIEAGSMTIRKDDVRLDQLFKSLQQDYNANASKKNIELRFDLPPKLPAIQGDRDKLAIVVQNLLGNALKYTPEGGTVSVGVDLSATEMNIEVRDSGIGISEEDQARVFEKFYRANDPRLGDITGSGLGLALAYEIVRLHGGEMTVESVLNEGSTFRVALPINAEGV
ncbi:MAG: ATP-binding protein, partial [Phycisphaeraceae bacterium]